VGVQYVWRALADHLVARIAAGEFPPGAMLPGEREMSEEYGVGVGTFRRAIRELRDRGVVVTLPAKGTYVT
jgi:DNA-binding GntR family transcriptional regulator